MKKLTVICMTLLAMLFAVSCRGPMGPEGPAGTANVASTTMTIKSTDWQWLCVYKDAENHERGQYYVEIDYPNVTQNVYNHGAVLVYMNIEGSWSQLPMTYYYLDTENDILAEASLEVYTQNNGGITLFWTQSDMWDVRPETFTFKIVCIEATVYEHRSDVNYSSYESVKTAFQLDD